MVTKNEQQMAVEDKAYMKMCAAITKAQRRKWNAIQNEMWTLSDSLLDRARLHASLHGDSDGAERAERLHALISQLPIFDEDGKGFRKFGTAVEDF